MKIIEVNHNDRYHIQQFNDLPFRIYKNCPFWVPPLTWDVNLLFDRNNNPFYKHSNATFFLAMTGDGSPISRLVVLNNQNYNEFNHSAIAFFCLFESINDQQAARAIFDAGFAWARSQGLTSIVGPRGFTALDGLGLLVEGFEYRPAFGITYNHAYYPNLVEAAGFQKESDIVSGYLPADITFPEKFDKIAKLVQERKGLKVVNFNNKRELRKMIPKIKEMYNNSLEGTTGNVPLTAEEVEKIANQLIWFANPKLIKIIQKDDKAVGFLFAYPDITAAVQKVGGKIYPFGWIHLLVEMKRTEWVNINGAGILEQYQGLGGTAILFSEMYKSVLEGKFKHAELIQIGVDNDKMQRELRDLGVDFYKTHRTYQRTL